MVKDGHAFEEYIISDRHGKGEAAIMYARDPTVLDEHLVGHTSH